MKAKSCTYPLQNSGFGFVKCKLEIGEAFSRLQASYDEAVYAVTILGSKNALLHSSQHSFSGAKKYKVLWK